MESTKALRIIAPASQGNSGGSRLAVVSLDHGGCLAAKLSLQRGMLLWGLRLGVGFPNFPLTLSFPLVGFWEGGYGWQCLHNIGTVRW